MAMIIAVDSPFGAGFKLILAPAAATNLPVSTLGQVDPQENATFGGGELGGRANSAISASTITSCLRFKLAVARLT